LRRDAAHSTAQRMQLAALGMGIDAALMQLGRGDPAVSAPGGCTPSGAPMDPSSGPHVASGFDDVHGFKSSVMQCLAHLHAIPHLKERLKVSPNCIAWILYLANQRGSSVFNR